MPSAIPYTYERDTLKWRDAFYGLLCKRRDLATTSLADVLSFNYRDLRHLPRATRAQKRAAWRMAIGMGARFGWAVSSMARVHRR